MRGHLNPLTAKPTFRRPPLSIPRRSRPPRSPSTARRPRHRPIRRLLPNRQTRPRSAPHGTRTQTVASLPHVPTFSRHSVSQQSRGEGWRWRTTTRLSRPLRLASAVRALRAASRRREDGDGGEGVMRRLRCRRSRLRTQAVDLACWRPASALASAVCRRPPRRPRRPRR